VAQNLLPEKAAAIYTHIVSFNVLLDLSLLLLPVNQFCGNDYRCKYDQWKRQVRRNHKKKITDNKSKC
jgi:hypothetical protein